MTGLVFICGLFFCFQTAAFSQIKIAVLTPDKSGRSREFAERLETKLSNKFNVLDDSLAETAFLSGALENPFNLTVEEAHNAGSAIGCNYFLLVRAALQRRSAFGREEFYEAYSVVYVVSAKSGNLVLWNLDKFDADLSSEAEEKLLASPGKLAAQISSKISDIEKSETNRSQKNSIENVSAENSVNAENFRPPLPYRRISPVYTKIADYYNIKATVDILVGIGDGGKVLDTQIVRWAGYGLDESVAEAVRKMNWRPAERRGKTLPVRILLRYNFKDIENEIDEN